MANKHHFVSISVMPVDVRMASDGYVEYTEMPERQLDHTPEQVCQICYTPLDVESVTSACIGPKVPDNIEGIIDTRPEEEGPWV